MAAIRAMPVLQVSDMARLTAFYARMGFDGSGWDSAGEVVFTIAQRGDVTIGLQFLREPVRVNAHCADYICVTDVAALHDEFTSDGLEPTDLRRTQEDDCDDFDICDPDGHLIAFGQSLDPDGLPGLGKRRGKG